MASLYYCKQLAEEVDEGLGPKATSFTLSTHTKVLPLHSNNNIEVMSRSSSSDLLAHHKKPISSCDPKSRSLDVSCASSYTTNHHSTSGTASANIGNPARSRAVISTEMDLKSSDDLKMVPFKWEEAPGRPITTSSCNEMVTYNPSSLQLPPKLQCQSNQSPLHLLQKTCHESPPIKKLTQPINQSLSRSSPNKQILKKLCKYMSCTSHAPPFTSHSWNNYPPCIEFSPQIPTFDHNYKPPDELPFNDRFFFDRYSPKDLKYSASMDSFLPIFDSSARDDEFISTKALSFLAMEEHEEAESSTVSSSPLWKPMSFHQREGSASPCWQPSPIIKVHDKLPQDDDDDDDEGFHDFFSTASSMKPSQRTDCDAMQSACSSPSPWYLDFSPEEEEVHVEKRGSKLIVRIVALIKLKRVISKFKRRREGANHQLAESTMWSPTLATYLYNQQLEEEKQVISTPISSTISTNYSAESDGHSELGSNRLQIDPNYYLPSTIRTHFMNPNHYNCSDDDENSTPFGAHQECQACKKDSCFAEEEEENDGSPSLHMSRHRLSLKEQLGEFDDEYLAPPFHAQSNIDAPTLAGRPDTHFKCKGMCKVRKTVHVLASAIKLFLVQAEIGKRTGAHRSFQSGITPIFSTHSRFHFNQK